jgi:hypothetical protein
LYFHKRQEISVEHLIEPLNVEEKARAKDNTEKGAGQPSANLVRKKPSGKNKGNYMPPLTSLSRLQPSRRRSRTKLT